jgi:histidine ammonia-lyase
LSAEPHGPARIEIQLGVDRLTAEDVASVAREDVAVAPLAAAVADRMRPAADWVASTVEAIARAKAAGTSPPAWYGINTGFGAQAGRSALNSRYLTELLGRNLLASHAVGVGPWFDRSEIRATMLIRAQSLVSGRSGVRPEIVEAIIRMLNAGIYPAVPQQGSLGASGDLAPLAHLLLVMTEPPPPERLATDPHERLFELDRTDGEAFVAALPSDATDHLTLDRVSSQARAWRIVPGSEAMRPAGGKVALHAKEALALMNGSTVSTALAALVVADAQALLDHADLALAMTLEGIRGFRDPFLPQVHRARGHAGAERAAARVLSFLAGSELLDPGSLDMDPARIPPQDPYSVRCAPQVHGTIADTLDLARRWVEMDINAATDNPLIFLELPRAYKTISGGNFHGEPIAFAMDFLAIALTELGNISDRRMFMLTGYQCDKVYADPATRSGPLHGLPPFLIDEPAGRQGLNSGLMMLQATAASLVSECKTLAHPDSVDSIPSSGNQEDHVSMSMNAARHARDIVRNIEQVLALEFLCAAQAIALQRGKRGNERLRAGAGSDAACRVLRDAGVASLTQDRVLYPDIRTAVRLVRSGALLDAAIRAVDRPVGAETSRC